jgi:hypothetical protein
MKAINRRTVAMECIKQQKLLDSVWAILMAIASRIGPSGFCYPSKERIGSEANGRSLSTVKRAIADARKLGLLTQCRRIIDGKSLVTYSITPLAEPLHFDKSKQSWPEFVRANTRLVGIQLGESKADLVRRELTRARVLQ